MSKPATSAPKKEPQTQQVPSTQPSHKHVEASAPRGPKGAGPLPGGCHAQDCKSPEKRFNFCNEHYDQFKFGLIKKTGERVSDHEKKLEHYQAFKARQGVEKAA